MRNPLSVSRNSSQDAQPTDKESKTESPQPGGSKESTGESTAQEKDKSPSETGGTSPKEPTGDSGDAPMSLAVSSPGRDPAPESTASGQPQGAGDAFSQERTVADTLANCSADAGQEEVMDTEQRARSPEKPPPLIRRNTRRVMRPVGPAKRKLTFDDDDPNCPPFPLMYRPSFIDFGPYLTDRFREYFDRPVTPRTFRTFGSDSTLDRSVSLSVAFISSSTTNSNPSAQPDPVPTADRPKRAKGVGSGDSGRSRQRSGSDPDLHSLEYFQNPAHFPCDQTARWNHPLLPSYCPPSYDKVMRWRCSSSYSHIGETPDTDELDEQIRQMNLKPPLTSRSLSSMSGWSAMSTEETGASGQLASRQCPQTGPSGHLQPGPSGYSQPGPSGLSQSGPSGLSQPGPSGLSQPGPSGHSQPGPSGLSQPGPSGLSQPGPSGHSQPGHSEHSQPGPSRYQQPGPSRHLQPCSNYDSSVSDDDQQLGPSGYSQPGPSGYSQPGPSGYSLPGSSGYSQPGPSGYSQPGPSGYSQPGPSGYPQPRPSRHLLPCSNYDSSLRDDDSNALRGWQTTPVDMEHDAEHPGEDDTEGGCASGRAAGAAAAEGPKTKSERSGGSRQVLSPNVVNLPGPNLTSAAQTAPAKPQQQPKKKGKTKRK